MLVILLVTLASAFVINPYHYGLGDNSITIPFTRAFTDPGLYSGDLLIDQRRFYYTFLWDALGSLSSATGIGLPALFFATYLAALFGTFLAINGLAVAIFRRREIGLISIALLLFSRPTLGGVATIESMLSTRQVATPLLLFAIGFIVRRRLLWACVALGAAYLVHPLTTHYVIALLLGGTLAEARGRRAGTLLAGLALFVALASPILVWKLTRSPATLSLFSADPRWLEALHFRSANHMFPSTWGPGVLVHALVTLAVFGIAWWKRREPAAPGHRLTLSFAIVILVLCVVGEVFSEFHPVGIALLLQPLRSFQFLEYLASIYLAGYLGDSFRNENTIGDMIPPVLLAVLSLAGTAHWMRPLELILAIATLLAIRRARLSPSLSERGFAAAAAALVVVVVLAGALRDHARGTPLAFSIGNAQDRDWLDAQRWARGHTDRRDAFIVPPFPPGEFRVESERAIYADWEDGGLMNVNPAFGIEWLRRMRRLGFRGNRDFERAYDSLPATAVLGIASEMRADGRRVFLVTRRGRGERAFPVRYGNSRYVIYQVS